MLTLKLKILVNICKITITGSYGNEDNNSQKIKRPHLKDLEQSNGRNHEIISTKRTIEMNFTLYIGVAVYHQAKLRTLQFYYRFVDKYIDKSDFSLSKSLFIYQSFSLSP